MGSLSQEEEEFAEPNSLVNHIKGIFETTPALDFVKLVYSSIELDSFLCFLRSLLFELKFHGDSSCSDNNYSWDI